MAASYFKQKGLLFLCPFCQEDLKLQEKSYICPKGHTFDVAKSGYVNLLPQLKQAPIYDKESFQSRRQVFEAGLYGHILSKMEEVIAQNTLSGEVLRLLDSGCGEGYYARALSIMTQHMPEDEQNKRNNRKENENKLGAVDKICGEKAEREIWAFDISKASVELAAKADREKRVNWFVADIARLPLKPKSFGGILSIYSLANYKEFLRVLKPDGFVLKVIPGLDHLQELRALVKGQLKNPEYSNQQIKDLFATHLQSVEGIQVSQTFPLDEKTKEALVNMSPLLFQVKKEDVDIDSLKEITISGEILLGKVW